MYTNIELQSYNAWIQLETHKKKKKKKKKKDDSLLLTTKKRNPN